jgi:hypothetical protein
VPLTGLSKEAIELITEMPRTVKKYDRSRRGRFLDLKREIANIAKRPRATPRFISTVLSRMHTRKITIPMRKKERALVSFLE